MLSCCNAAEARAFGGLRRIGVSAMVLGATSAAFADSPSFQLLGSLAPGRSSEAYGVSSSGDVVVGAAVNALGETEAFRWEAGAMRGLHQDMQHHFEPGRTAITRAFATSADGSVVVGDGRFVNAYRWENNSVTLLGEGGARGISDDGRVIAGTRAYYVDGVLHQLPTLPGFSDTDGTAVSADGSTIVGSSSSIGGATSGAFRLHDGVFEDLGNLGGARANAAAVSDDGSVVVGSADNGSFVEAFRWENGQMVGLGRFGDDFSVAFGVSGDGRIVVGQSSGRAFIWDETHGMRDLTAVVTNDLGIDLGGRILRHAHDITSDGRVIVGQAVSSSGASQAYRLVIPAPGTAAALLLFGGLGASRRRRK